MRIYFLNQYKPRRKRFIFFDFQFGLAFSGFSLLDIAVVLYHSPVGFDLALVILGLGVEIERDTTQ